MRLQLLPPHSLLLICLLICWLSREALTHIDWMEWAILGHISCLPNAEVFLVTAAAASTYVAGDVSSGLLAGQRGSDS